MTATDELDETGPADPAADIEPDDTTDEVDEDFLPARRRRMGPLTITLALLLVAALGVYGGVQLQKHRGKTTATTTVNFPGRGAGGFGGAGGAGGSTAAAAGGAGAGGAGGQGGAGGAIFGTVKLVDGNTIYVSATDGSITKVTTTPGSTTITRSVSGTAADLQPGQTVVVQGAAGSDGTVAATRVTEGGLGGARGGGGGGTGG